MFTDHVLPLLRAISGEVFVSRRLLRVAGMGESAVDEIAAPIYKKYDNVETSILFTKVEIEIHIAAKANTYAEADMIAQRLTNELQAAIGKAVFSTNGDTMEVVIGKILTERGETLSVAESCTGGLIGRRVTEVPGSSSYFMEGAITYSNEAKTRALGVDPGIIHSHGAVSPECAEAMAAGMKAKAGTDHAISVTGIAGPDGGSPAKPVGTVFIGYSGPAGTRSFKIILPGDRYLIRWRASQAALEYLRRQLMKG